MATNLQDFISATIVEKDIFQIEFVEKEVVSVEFKSADILTYHQRVVTSELIKEVPTKLSAKRFQTSEEYVTGSLSCYINGLKVHNADITEISTTVFEIVDSTIVGDTVEVEYIKIP